MRLCGRNHLDELKKTKPSSIAWVNTWSAEIDTSVWKSAHEVQNQFPKVFTADGQAFAFKVDGCDINIETIIDFNLLLVLVTSVKVM